MNILKLSITTAFLFFSLVTFSNDILLKGIVTENHNEGFRMVGVQVEIINSLTQQIVESLKTNNLGEFETKISKLKNYQVKLIRKNFLSQVQKITSTDVTRNGEIFLNLKMERKPGYVFDVTLTNGKKDGVAKLKGLEGARIEIYNNTSKVSELDLENHPSGLFQFVFESGNYYTIMIRKQGFFNKRIEAYVDIEGCILCFEGLDVKGQEVFGSTSHENKRGSFLADIVLQPIEINNTIEIENIYYDFDQANIRPDAALELDKLTTILRDNQHVILELGSHTDARGNDDYNLKLSDSRAKTAVQYLTSKAGIGADRMTWKGYGESQLVNQCDDGVECEEQVHQENRRTTLKIIGLEDDPLAKKSLKEIIENNQKHLLISQN